MKFCYIQKNEQQYPIQKRLAAADLLELIEKANEGFLRGAKVDYVNVLEELLVKVKD